MSRIACKRSKSRLESISDKRRDLALAREDRLRLLAFICTIEFSLVLIWALWLKFNDIYSITQNYAWLSELTLTERFLYDLIPFQFRYDVINQVIEVLCNGIVFAPFGVLLNVLFEEENVWRDLAICFIFSLFIELTQLFTIIGSFATADLLMNTLGYLFGYAVYKCIFIRLSPKWRTRLLHVCNACLFAMLIVATVRTVECLDVIIGILTRTLGK